MKPIRLGSTSHSAARCRTMRTACCPSASVSGSMARSPACLASTLAMNAPTCFAMSAPVWMSRYFKMNAVIPCAASHSAT